MCTVNLPILFGSKKTITMISILFLCGNRTVSTKTYKIFSDSTNIPVFFDKFEDLQTVDRKMLCDTDPHFL